MRPSIGRIVHCVSYGSPGGELPAQECRAAIVTEVETNEYVGLAVYNPTGLWFNRRVRYDEGRAPGTWHWPERVE